MARSPCSEDPSESTLQRCSKRETEHLNWSPSGMEGRRFASINLPATRVEPYGGRWRIETHRSVAIFDPLSRQHGYGRLETG